MQKTLTQQLKATKTKPKPASLKIENTSAAEIASALERGTASTLQMVMAIMQENKAQLDEFRKIITQQQQTIAELVAKPINIENAASELHMPARAVSFAIEYEDDDLGNARPARLIPEYPAEH